MSETNQGLEKWTVGEYVPHVTDGGGERALAIWSKGDRPVCLVTPRSKESEADLRHAFMITTAVNNTYLQGINPEAVPDLLAVARKIRMGQLAWRQFMEELEAAITKADAVETGPGHGV
jgi:hypothetical protein